MTPRLTYPLCLHGRVGTRNQLQVYCNSISVVVIVRKREKRRKESGGGVPNYWADLITSPQALGKGDLIANFN